jgi:hypothetical protein
LVASVAPDEKLAVNLTEDPMYMVSHLPHLAASRILSLSFNHLINKFLSLNLSYLGLLSFLDFHICIFKFVDVLSHYFFKYSFCSSLMSMWACFMRSYRLFHLFFHPLHFFHSLFFLYFRLDNINCPIFMITNSFFCFLKPDVSFPYEMNVFCLDFILFMVKKP